MCQASILSADGTILNTISNSVEADYKVFSTTANIQPNSKNNLINFCLVARTYFLFSADLLIGIDLSSTTLSCVPGACPAVCGDNYCDPTSETSQNCPIDCVIRNCSNLAPVTRWLGSADFVQTSINGNLVCGNLEVNNSYSNNIAAFVVLSFAACKSTISNIVSFSGYCFITSDTSLSWGYKVEASSLAIQHNQKMVISSLCFLTQNSPN